ncbi:Lipid A export ATP-binding/permease protein MsbA [Rhodovulum sp. P5]|uniref:ABC transporter ATP-binding protein n=1 Tax=Rhodovulum sp. P5 TaxID=1564506 RepID=UPI0009C2E229|nr:ABC transporter ATP-binding protein [Rhodovulum sp. P5]ARE39567.1 Lipid A export ATP-binding/permease protein MsbA [Rhodovulum sp. P5]
MRSAKKTRRPLFHKDDTDNIAWFWVQYLRDKAPWLVLILVMVSLQGVVYQQFLSLTENGLRVIFEKESVADLIRVCAIVFVLFATRGFLSYIVPRMSSWLAGNAVMKMRGDLIDHLLRLDLAYFERTKAGDIILRLVEQANTLTNFISQSIVGAVRDVITVIIVSGYLILKSPLLFLAAIIVIPAIILMMQVVSHRIKDIQAKAQAATGRYMNGIEEMSNGMRTVKILGQEPFERARLLDATSDIRDLTIRLQAAQALVMPSIDLVSAFVYVLVIGGGGYMVLSGNFGMDAAGIVTFLLGLVILFDPARRVAQFFARLQAHLILLDSIRAIHRERPAIADAPDAVSDFERAGDIQFDNVTFAYDPATPLFSGLDMGIRGGASTAIVGATGSGKTTILSLITRLYDVQAGAITIGGRDVRDIRVRDLRESFSVVAQDIVIFNDSIWENIRYVRPDATEAEIWAAAEAAEIADLIRTRGDAPLGPKGSQLSGGQKQRIAIARAFLRSAPILLLDEATSALDQRTEERIQGALSRLSEGKTTIIVAHRLSSIAHVDWIYVLDAGRIAEQGKHVDLMARGGLYAAMYSAQKDGYA